MACVKRPVLRTRATKMQVLCANNVLTRTATLATTDILSNIVFGSHSDTSLPYSLKLKQMIYRNSYTTPEIAIIDVTIENGFCNSKVNDSLTFAPDMMFGTLEEEN